jgi:NADH dehydrogenase (ubiquinone) Fe-S protein 4
VLFLSHFLCAHVRQFDTPNKWVNPLMGWTSARDTAQQLREMLYFEREEDAVGFAQREGFQYTILPFHAKKIKAKAFADNFKWRGPPKEEQKKE